MMTKEYLILGIGGIIVCGLLFLYFYFLTPLFFKKKKAPYISSFDRSLNLMKDLEIKPDTTLIDLGCGDGKALRFFIKEFKMKHATGYDINRFAIFLGKILNKREKIGNITLIKSDFSKANLKDYDYIYIYLRAEQMEKIENRVFENKKEDAIIISNTFKFKNHTPFKIIKNKQGFDAVMLYQ